MPAACFLRSTVRGVSTRVRLSRARQASRLRCVKPSVSLPLDGFWAWAQNAYARPKSAAAKEVYCHASAPPAGASSAATPGRSRSRLALTQKQEHQFNEENDHHHDLQEEGPALVKLIHHELVQFAGRMQLAVNELAVVLHAHPGCGQAI